MVSHIIKLLTDLISISNDTNRVRIDGLTIFNVPKMIYDEIKEFKAKEFSPDVRYDFVILKEQMKSYSMRGSTSGNLQEYRNTAQALIKVLEKYSAHLENYSIKQFAFLNNTELKNIVERDYFELSTILFPEGAWKSVVILAGSILEAILFDVLSNEQNLDLTNGSSKSPKKPIEGNSNAWTLQKLIEVAVNIDQLPNDRASSIDQVLRDYRNFVHPKKEIRSKHQCTEAEAYMAKGSLDGVINYLEEKVQT